MTSFGYKPQLRMPPPFVPGFAPPGFNSIPPPFGQPPPIGQPNSFGQPSAMAGEVGFDGKMLRKAMARKTIDYNPSAVRYIEDRVWKRDYRDTRALQADSLYTMCLTLPQDMLDNPANCVTTKFMRAALNKDPRPIFCVHWTPDGRRLITGASSGEFTLWNGLTFNFETILQAHNSAVRSMIWSRNEQWMMTGDDKGYIKYWQTNMNNVKMFQGHIEAIRGLSFSPTDDKFTSCSDDRTVRIFDFTTCVEESVLQGHGSDVKCVDWHPFKALIVSGSKDSQQPIILWDPRMNKKITTLHAHKNTCTDLKWNQFNGNWLISSSRDHLCKLFDIRNLKEEVQSFRGHKKDACTVSWHPVYEKMFASGGADGSIFFWLCGADKELGSMEDAHEGMVWDLSWHPLGHMLVSGSNDRSTRFWTRNRPGDTIVDKTDESSMPNRMNERVTGIIFKNIELAETNVKNEGVVSLPGLGLDEEVITGLNSSTDGGKEEALSSPVKLNLPPPSEYSMPPPLIQFNQQQQQHQQQHMLMQHIHLQQQQQQMLVQNPIPGLDLDDEEARKRKAPYSKPIPKDFEKAWSSNLPMNAQSSAILQMASIVIDPVTKIPSLTLPSSLMQPPPNLLQSQIPTSGSLSVPPPNLLTSMMNMPPPMLAAQGSPPNLDQNSPPGDKLPSRLMDLMSGSERDDTAQGSGSFKRKLAHEISSEDTDDRNWSTASDESQMERNYGNNNNKNAHQAYSNYNNNNSRENSNMGYNNNRRGNFENRRGGGQNNRRDFGNGNSNKDDGNYRAGHSYDNESNSDSQNGRRRVGSSYGSKNRSGSGFKDGDNRN